MKNATSTQRRIIKAYADARSIRYRITATGEVHFHGTMPNTNDAGWYFFAHSPDDAVAYIQTPTF